MGTRLIHLVAALLLAWPLSACQATGPATLSQDQVKKIESLWAELPIHTSFREVKPPSLATDGSPRFNARYKAAAPYDEVRRFYTEEFAKSGWQFIRERELKDRGRIKGERLLEFQKNGYELDVKYSGEREGELGWAYQIELSWPAQ
jgi:hypothetical protein